MSILEKKTGSGIDALIISLIMAKVFLLEYLGMAGIVNNVIFFSLEFALSSVAGRFRRSCFSSSA